ncbi:MAG: hypothetical protein DWQ06_07060 [Calditrichaeota bacterium]|nr:MAG: hypothetical protein DWQ06_07060 [Calditrichota bacterium]
MNVGKSSNGLTTQTKMKKTLIFILFLTNLVFAKDPLEEIYTHIDTALTTIKMAREDFKMLHTYVKEDSFRLNLVKKLFDEPLYTFSITDSIARKGFELAENQTEFLTFASSLLDVKTDRIPKLSEKQFLPNNTKLPPLLKSSLEKFLQAENLVQKTVESELSVFSEEEKEFIFEQTSDFLTQSDSEEEVNPFTSRKNEYESYESSKKYFELVQKINLSRIFEVCKFQQTVFEKLVKDFKKTRFFPKEVLKIETKFGKIAFGTRENDFFEGNYFLILDCGGSDTYRLSEKTDKFQNTKIFDANGNDFYESQSYGLGSGFFGLGILIDEKGDDTYKSLSFSQGSGIFGIGILTDKSGNDVFTGDTCVQGAGFFGIGLLWDFDGTDTYKSEIFSQAFGGVKGFGGLFDKKGNDFYLPGGKYVDVLRYEARFEFLGQGFGFGIRPLASGGIGILADSSGNDTYRSDIFGQGSAYWFALGGIVDFSGNDTYSSHQYAQGSGVHFAFGNLLDYSGTDNYVSYGVSQGCGHDFAFGGLLDLKGEDSYVCHDLSQGGGNANAISFFCDTEGKDGYLQKKRNTLGYSDRRRDFGMLGLFFDLGGKDTYTQLIGGENSTWIHSTYGYGVDKEILKESSKTEKAEKDSVKLETELEKLFVQASTPLHKFQKDVQPARDKIIEIGLKAMPFLVSKFDTFSPREAWALRLVIPKIEGAEEFLHKVLKENEKTKIGLAIYILGEIGKEESVPFLEKMALNENWKIRDVTATSLGKIKSLKAEKTLQELCKDENFLVRKSASLGLGRIKAQNSTELLLELLKDESQAVRHQAERSLAMTFEFSENSVLEKLKAENILEQERLHLIGVLELVGKDCSKEGRKILENLLKSQSELVRGYSAKALLKIKPDSKKLRKLKEKEESAFVIGILESEKK